MIDNLNQYRNRLYPFTQVHRHTVGVKAPSYDVSLVTDSAMEPRVDKHEVGIVLLCTTVTSSINHVGSIHARSVAFPGTISSYFT